MIFAWLKILLPYAALAIGAVVAFLWIQSSDNAAITAAMEVEALTVAKAELQAQARLSQLEANRFKTQSERDRKALAQETADAQAADAELKLITTERAARLASARALAESSRIKAAEIETRLNEAIGQWAGTLAEKEAAYDNIRQLRISLAQAREPEQCRATVDDVAHNNRMRNAESGTADQNKARRLPGAPDINSNRRARAAAQ
jgi:hypothetical protein